VEWTEACLERIDKLEPAVKAWVHLDREGARRTARERAAQAAAGAFVGPLHGVPVALKDIFDVAGMPTRAGGGAGGPPPPPPPPPPRAPHVYHDHQGQP
jgi:Asp-tRNA(Asn)/Glu-tRNA(Gln) amidotransferase A subunit family amidase